MRCKACDRAMTDRETTRKDVNGRFVDLCSGCYVVSAQTIIESLDDDFLKGTREYNGYYSSKKQTNPEEYDEQGVDNISEPCTIYTRGTEE